VPPFGKGGIGGIQVLGTCAIKAKTFGYYQTLTLLPQGREGIKEKSFYSTQHA
jgi:hypothetical protein